MKRKRFAAPFLGWVAGAGMAVAGAQALPPPTVLAQPPDAVVPDAAVLPAFPVPLGPPPDAGPPPAPAPAVIPRPAVLAPAPESDEPPPHGGCPACAEVDGPPCFWATGEFLAFWIKRGPLDAPLLTTGNPDPATGAGVMGRPSTSVLFGGPDLTRQQFSGGRFGVGVWLGADRMVGVEGNVLFLVKEQLGGFTAGPNDPGPAVLTVPVINALNGSETGILINFPKVFSGGVNVNASSRSSGAELNADVNLLRSDFVDLTVLVGGRYFGLREDLNLQYESTPQAGGAEVFLGTLKTKGFQTFIADDFRTDSNFVGGQVGARGEVHYGPVSLQLVSKLAVGTTFETVQISGNTTLLNTAIRGAQTYPGGIFALPSNMGHYAQDQVAVLPELGATLGWRMSRHTRLTVGYTFLYLSDVVRPGDQVDRVVNPLQLPTSLLFTPGLPVYPRPAFTFRTTDFWAQGINVGLSFQY